jgi:hypothetical protein
MELRPARATYCLTINATLTAQSAVRHLSVLQHGSEDWTFNNPGGIGPLSKSRRGTLTPSRSCVVPQSLDRDVPDVSSWAPV